MQDDALTERSTLPSAVPTDPWSGLNESGDNLTVDNFITTVMSQTVNALRRVTTLPYARRFGLTVSEWRILSLMAHARSMPFAELVVQSTSDKALVSRTLRLLEQRGLVSLQAEGPTPRKRLTCNITPAGQALHAEVIPVARKAQASMIQLMTPEERRVMYVALKRIHRQCLEADASAGEDEDS
ncbi:MarR family winged helix-turn-helix transcriptional regulator [Variovorax sp. 770b2]|uniref:MarR family winged helix-turn-helix transcriptional regulator n=1 Tax=Variovorax sp. 770b2 TaxID=1566271 RepID=UPI0008F06A52|nr:MarR family transcriptional regulator [Variovorax sp. 770b2]SFP31360.1 DNA-binding transcriptional regulator, MarR family [Variovorax sp. 770b2]